MQAWIQTHDFSSREFEAPDSSYAKKALREFDWSAELDRQASREESCDPGLGLVFGDGHILHFCPDRQQRYMVHFHAPPKSRFFARPRTLTMRDVPVGKAEQMIDAFFQRDFDVITRNA